MGKMSHIVRRKILSLRYRTVFPLRIKRKYSETSTRTIRIGCASGFWGDTAVSTPQLIHGGEIDFLVYDYLSEITMSLLAAVKKKMPELGYASDFVQIAMAPHLQDIKRKGIRVISNAGGINPQACAQAIRTQAADQDIKLNVAVVTGDDLLPWVETISRSGITDMHSGQAFPAKVTSLNAYLGAGPIARALDHGADIVITGRCTDSAVVLAPLIHSFKWRMDQFDLLAAGSVAGHLVECGAQATGGIFTDWHQVPNWDTIGFPIVECSENGDFILTKPKKSGGLVSKGTASEQLVYEIHDPANYELPDVSCDFRNISITDIEGQTGEAVLVQGAKGNPPSDKYKVSATYADGYRATATVGIRGPRAVEKTKKTCDAILARNRAIFKQLGFDDFKDVNLEIFGAEEYYGKHATPDQAQKSREAVGWLAVHHNQKMALDFFAREVAPAGTGMAPGLTLVGSGRPRVSPVLKLFSFLHRKKDLDVAIHMNGEFLEKYTAEEFSASEVSRESPAPVIQELKGGRHTFRLEELAFTRSGDKGNSANIGVIARHPSFVPYLRDALTAEAVEKYFIHLFDEGTSNNVQRFELPGVDAFNFVLQNSLGGGGIASLRTDPQGKAYGQLLLDFEVKDVPDLLALTKQS